MTNGNGQQPIAQARPALYIEVLLSGQTQPTVYGLNIARELHRELGLALAAIDAAEQVNQQEAGETDRQIPLLTPDDQDSPASDDAQAAADGDAAPDA